MSDGDHGGFWQRKGAANGRRVGWGPMGAMRARKEQMMGGLLIVQRIVGPYLG